MLKLWIASLAACGLLAAQTVVDGVGVTVQTNGAALLHRTGVNYPQAALQRGVQGAVSVEVKLDSDGAVSDAQILTGPDELRKPALESVLQWHFSKELAGSTRVVQITFELPKASPFTVVPGMVVTPPRGPQMQGRIKSIRIVGLPEKATAELLAALPLHEGDQWKTEDLQKLNQAVKTYDEHLSLQPALGEQTASGDRELSLVISAASTPSRIKVGGNVQAAMAITKVPPVYPPDAKTAHIAGVVHLAVVIAKDGTIESASVLSGPSELTQSALDAVKQWVYRPTLLNGNPVQVETTVDVNYTLNQ
jgi:TonB family protein